MKKAFDKILLKVTKHVTVVELFVKIFLKVTKNVTLVEPFFSFRKFGPAHHKSQFWKLLQFWVPVNKSAVYFLCYSNTNLWSMFFFLSPGLHFLQKSVQKKTSEIIKTLESDYLTESTSLRNNKFLKSSSLRIVEPLIRASLDLQVTGLTEIVPDLKINLK